MGLLGDGPLVTWEEDGSPPWVVWRLSIALWVLVVLMDVMPPSFPCLVAQASCVCKPGLVSINHNVSAGCFAYCSPHSCDRSATCQVTPDGKIRWALGAERTGWSGQGQGCPCVHPQVKGPWGDRWVRARR